MFDIFKSKFKKNSQMNHSMGEDVPDEEYQLPTLSKRNFPITKELQRRREDEKLIKRYGIRLEKEGKFL